MRCCGGPRALGRQGFPVAGGPVTGGAFLFCTFPGSRVHFLESPLLPSG